MPTLFELTGDVLALDALIEERGGELGSPEVEAAWLAMAAELHHNESVKLDGYVNYIRTLEMEAAAAHAEAEQYLMKARTRENRVKWLKERIKDYLILTGRKKVETATKRTIAIQANGGPTPLVIHPTVTPDTVPAEFVRVVKSFDTDVIRKAIDTDGVPWATLGERGNHLRIR